MHPYHLVNESPWPIISSFLALATTLGLLAEFHLSHFYLILFTVLALVSAAFLWWNSVSLERTYQGLHTYPVQNGIRWGIILFITSEVLFFFSFFWAFFFVGINSRVWLGSYWPPLRILTFNPLQIPLLNTLILLSSGVTVTWSHHRILNNNFKQAKKRLLYTIFLGIYFTALQRFEYWEASFRISDSRYGSCFYLMTGFHGFHVIIGTIFLLACYLRLRSYHFSFSHHFRFEAAAWYWHFVDVVWLFLYISVYWWGKG